MLVHDSTCIQPGLMISRQSYLLYRAHIHTGNDAAIKFLRSIEVTLSRSALLGYRFLCRSGGNNQEQNNDSVFIHMAC